MTQSTGSPSSSSPTAPPTYFLGSQMARSRGSSWAFSRRRLVTAFVQGRSRPHEPPIHRGTLGGVLRWTSTLSLTTSESVVVSILFLAMRTLLGCEGTGRKRTGPSNGMPRWAFLWGRSIRSTPNGPASLVVYRVGRIFGTSLSYWTRGAMTSPSVPASHRFASVAGNKSNLRYLRRSGRRWRTPCAQDKRSSCAPKSECSALRLGTSSPPSTAQG